MCALGILHGDLPAHVVTGPNTAVLGEEHDFVVVGEGLEILDGPVCAAVVDDDDLVGSEFLLLDTGNHFPECFQTVEAED